MPMFKVALHRKTRDGYNGHEPNPFLAPMPSDSKTSRMLVREWEFEAKDEREVLRLLEEAQASGVAGVQGFRLRSIERVPESEPEHLAKRRGKN